MTYADAVTGERSLVVPDRATAIGLTSNGIAATTFGDVMGAPDAVIVGYFIDSEPAVVVVKRGAVQRAAAVVNRLDRLAIPYRVMRELLDRSRR